MTAALTLSTSSSMSMPYLFALIFWAPATRKMHSTACTGATCPVPFLASNCTKDCCAYAQIRRPKASRCLHGSHVRWHSASVLASVSHEALAHTRTHTYTQTHTYTYRRARMRTYACTGANMYKHTITYQLASTRRSSSKCSLLITMAHGNILHLPV